MGPSLWQNHDEAFIDSRRLMGLHLMRILLFLAVLANSLDLVATALGIHWFGNREGNPLLAGIAQNHWFVFIVIKGLLIPALIVRLYRYRNTSPVLSTAGMAIVTVALTVAVGQWLGWIAGVITVPPSRL
ncbi:MAG TPA: DUF5658 family protein [Candidatus Udaeobacter sp.]|nr:DUF5658 family protein [Candidatus Udaeobacter sp.]